MYHERPKQLLRALESVRNQKHKNWHIAFIDDGSVESGEKIIREFFTPEEIEKVTFYNTNDTPEIKKQRAEKHKHLTGSDDKNSGMWLNPYFNKAVRENKHDIALFLCDDDVLQEFYLDNLNNFYNNNISIQYSYCVLILFDERYHNWIDRTDLNNRFLYLEPMNPFFHLDTAQVSWRSSSYTEDNVWFDETYHLFFDAYWYKRLYEKYGACVCNNIVGQYKNFDKEAFHKDPEMIEYYKKNNLE